MTKVEKLEREIRELNQAELIAFREWFHEFVSEKWDHQIEKDARSGRLDKLAEKSIEAHRAGRSTKL
jgi:hypothetical protein